MLSRLAEHVYWMGRYLERAENTARLVSTGTHLALDQPHSVRIDWQALVEVLGGPGAAQAPADGESPERAAMRQLIPASSHPSSIHASVQLIRENARTVRDLLPDELRWRINQLYFHTYQGAGAAVDRAHRYDFLRGVIHYAQGISGVIDGTLSRGPTYHFLMLGRFLERADMTTRTVDVRAATLPKEPREQAPVWDDAVWMNVLRYLGAYSQFRQQRGPGMQGPEVVDFLLRDERFPRAVCFCTERMRRALVELPQAEAPQRAVTEARERVMAPIPAEIEAQALHQRLDALQVDLAGIHGRLAETYFPGG